MFRAHGGKNGVQLSTWQHIYVVELVSGPSLAFLIVIIWSKFVFLNAVCQKHYKKSSFARKTVNSYYLVQVGLFLDPQRGPDNSPYLDQIVIIKNGHLFAFVFFYVLKCLFYCVLYNINQNLPKKGPQKR